MNYFLKITSLVLLSTTFLISCDKDEDNENICNDTNTVLQDKSVSLDFSFTVGDQTFLYDEVYNINGTSVSFDDVRFYLSDFAIHDDADNIETLESFLLVDAGAADNNFNIGITEFDHIHELHLLVGLNDIVNHQDPVEADTPLNDASMHWGWNPDAGYKFIKIECLVDSDEDGTPDAATSMHVATDGLSRAVELEIHEDTEEGANELAFKLDLIDFFENIDLSSVGTSHGGTQVNGTLANNVAGAFQLID